MHLIKLTLPTNVKRRHIKQAYLDKDEGLIKPDRLLSEATKVERCN
jgi:hypothetical protein